MIKISVTGTQKIEQKALKIRKFKSELIRKLFNLSEDFANKIVTTSKEKYLSGPRPTKLGVITGRLRASIRSKVSSKDNEIRIVEGTDIVYGRIHELGFRGKINIPAHIRKIKSRDVKGKSKDLLAKGIASIPAHTRQVDIKARPFLKPSVEENLPWFKQKIINILEGVANG